MIFYKELYFRHIYSRLQTKHADRVGSWQNYCKLLDLIIDELEEGEEWSFALPAQWIWDILDEFIYHYQTYCNARGKTAKQMKEHDIKEFRDNPDVFETTKVLN